MKLTSKTSKVVLIDLDARNQIGVASEKAMAKMARLLRDFTQWQLDTNTFPILRGSWGPFGFEQGYTPSNAKKVLAWLAERGVKPTEKV